MNRRSFLGAALLLPAAELAPRRAYSFLWAPRGPLLERHPPCFDRLPDAIVAAGAFFPMGGRIYRLPHALPVFWASLPLKIAPIAER